MSTAVEIAYHDDVRLAGDHLPIVGDARGSIVMICVFGVRCASHQRFVVLVAASGYEVLLFSYRGSEGDDSAVANYCPADRGREGISAALAWRRARAPKLPRYFVGHSTGAQLLSLTGQASGLSGAVFIAGSFPYWRCWRGRQRWQVFGLSCVVVPPLTGLLRRFPSCFFDLGNLDMSSHFICGQARWVRQPDYLLAPRFGLQRQGYEALDIPVISFLFEDDDYVPWAAAEKLHQVYVAAYLELRRKGRAEGAIGHLRLFHNEALQKELLDYFRKLPDAV